MVTVFVYKKSDESNICDVEILQRLCWKHQEVLVKYWLNLSKMEN